MQQEYLAHTDSMKWHIALFGHGNFLYYPKPISWIMLSVNQLENITDQFGKVCDFCFSLIWRPILLSHTVIQVYLSNYNSGSYFYSVKGLPPGTGSDLRAKSIPHGLKVMVTYIRFFVLFCFLIVCFFAVKMSSDCTLQWLDL